jgi:hypothetical protein
LTLKSFAALKQTQLQPTAKATLKPGTVDLVLTRSLVERVSLIKALFDALEHNCSKHPAFGAAL